MNRLRYFIAVIGCFWWPGGFSVTADSWAPPKQFEAWAANGQFKASIIPPIPLREPWVVVYGLGEGKPKEFWRAELDNKISPSAALLSGDGEYLVTLDNWAAIGYGDNVLAFYNRRGLLAKYSLEEIAPLPKFSSSSHSVRNESYTSKFPHSAGSRHWRTDCLGFIAEDSSPSLFALWLDWDNRWAAWNMKTGKRVKATNKLTEDFNREGRTKARSVVTLKDVPEESHKNGLLAYPDAALLFLDRLNYPEDKPFIESWLLDSNFSLGYGTASAGSIKLILKSESYKRSQADRIIERRKNQKTDSSSKPYNRLGILNCVVEFPEEPKRGMGRINLYLIPESNELAAWNSTRPTQYLAADLRTNFPIDFYSVQQGDDQVKDLVLTKNVRFEIAGITPGSYRIKAVWDKVEPFSAADEILCHPGKGDYESIDSPIIVIKAGEITEAIGIECTTPVK